MHIRMKSIAGLSTPRFILYVSPHFFRPSPIESKGVLNRNMNGSVGIVPFMDHSLSYVPGICLRLPHPIV